MLDRDKHWMQSCIYLGPGELLEFESMIRCGPSARSDAVFSVDCKLVFCYVKDISGMGLRAKQSGARGRPSHEEEHA